MMKFQLFVAKGTELLNSFGFDKTINDHSIRISNSASPKCVSVIRNFPRDDIISMAFQTRLVTRSDGSRNVRPLANAELVIVLIRALRCLKLLEGDFHFFEQTFCVR